MYFNHAFHKLFVGTHASQTASGTLSGVDTGFLSTSGVQSVQLSNTSAPYGLGVGTFGLFFQDPVLGLVSVNASSTAITTGKPLLLAASQLYQNDKISPFIGGMKESNKSKLINPKFVSRFIRVDPCTPNQNVIHIGNTPFTAGSGITTGTIGTPGTGYTNGTYYNVSFSTNNLGSGALATVTVAGGVVTVVTITNPGSGYKVGDTLTSPVGIPYTAGTLMVYTVNVVTGENATCNFQFLCDETYYLRIDVKGSPALRTLSRNAYWNMDYYTGCCPANCIAPLPIDSTLAMIGWAQQIIDSKIVGPYILPVVYDQNGGAWYSPGTSGEFFNNPKEPGIGTVTIVNGGTGYTNGTFYNVQFGTLDQTPSNGSGATATVVVSGGVVTTVTITEQGTGYTVGDLIKLPLLEGANDNAVFSVATNIVPTWNNYVSPGYITGKSAGMSLTGAYVDTRFGDCTFYPSDWFEKQPVNIYASMVDETGDPCAFTAICVETQCNPRQAMGLGEQVIRDLILSESYLQNYFNTGKDLRIREITQGYDVTASIHRGNLYTRYQILHNVPRNYNPTGIFDNDQYLLEIITNGVSATFETVMSTWLSACGCNAVLELVQCQLAACPTGCPAITVATVTATGTRTVAYSSSAAASGGLSPYNYEVSSGVLPTGITINSSTGLVSGTPTVDGVYDFTVTATDSNGCPGSTAQIITITG